MSFNISEITGYVDENSFELISKAVLETPLADYFNVRVGLKAGSNMIPIMNGDFYVQDGGSCGYTTSGDTTISQIPLNLKAAKVNQSYCPETLRQTFLSQSLAAGQFAGNESIPFEQLMANYFVEKLNNFNENFIVNGDGSYSGLTQLITEAQGSTKYTGHSATWTLSGAVATAQGMYANLADEVMMRDDLILICSPQQYRLLQLAITQENYYHIAPGEAIVVPGTTCKVIPSLGATNAQKFMGSTETLYLGTDLSSDFEQFKLFYSADNDEMRSIMKWAIGVAVTEPALWVFMA
jgi:hypothetical protein